MSEIENGREIRARFLLEEHAPVLIFVAEGAGRLIFRLNSRMKMSIISDKRKIAWRGSFPRRRFFRFGKDPVVQGEIGRAHV